MEFAIPLICFLIYLLLIGTAIKKKKAGAGKRPAGRTAVPRQYAAQGTPENASRTIVSAAASTAAVRPERRVSEEEVRTRLKEYRERKQAEQNRDMDNWKRSAYSRKKSASPGNPIENLFGSDAGLQDDRHDWLAEQLAEERRAYRNVSAMFQMKMRHMQNCAAENARLDHALHCDARQLAEDSRAR